MGTAGTPWSRVRPIFEQALGLSGDERESYLHRECGSDADLRAEVEGLLALEALASELQPPRFETSAAAESPAPPLTRIGNYRIERELGAGGMGEVYLAHREGPGFEQPVALKLVKLGMDTREILSRFVRERAVLANLQHDGIARLFDAGATEDGRPYLVMEFVDGEPIDRFCDARALDVRRRIEIFCRVCDAVQFAHQRLVLHRDLKPGNVLVTQDGRPKLLDFGLAKLIARDGESVEDLTSTGERLFTPAYASPEQLRGEPVGIASDVFALGVVLYELLVGERPFAAGRGLTSSAQQTAQRPSTHVRKETSSVNGLDARRRSSELSGDLDLILLKAIHPDVQQRYATVDAFARDLRRYLSGLPVEARPDSWGYRAAKFTQRHRAATAASLVVLAALLASGGWAVNSYFSVVHARERADVQRDLADRRRVQVEQREGELRHMAVELIVEVHDSIARLRGATGPRATVMRLSADALQSVLASDSTDPSELLQVAGAFVRLGAVQGGIRGTNLGQLANAQESFCLGEQLAERALSFDATLHAAHRLLSEAHDHLSTIALSNGDFESASWENARASSESWKALPVDDRVDQRSEQERDLVTTGEITLEMRKYDEALRLFEAALPLVAEVMASQDKASALSCWARVEDDLSRAHRQLGHVDAALEHGDMALGLMKQVVRRASNDAKAEIDYSLALDRASRGRCEMGRFAEALAFADEDVELVTALVARDPLDADARLQLATALSQQSLARYMNSDAPHSLEPAQRAVELFGALTRESPTSMQYLRSLAIAEQTLGTTYFALGRPDDGKRAYDSAIEHIESAGRQASDARPFVEDGFGIRLNFVSALDSAAFSSDGSVYDAAAVDDCARACGELLDAIERNGGEARAPRFIRMALPFLHDEVAKCRGAQELNSRH